MKGTNINLYTQVHIFHHDHSSSTVSYDFNHAGLKPYINLNEHFVISLIHNQSFNVAGPLSVIVRQVALWPKKIRSTYTQLQKKVSIMQLL